MRVLAIVPAYSVVDSVSEVVEECLSYVDNVLVVDDCCPQESGKKVERDFDSVKSVSVLFHANNQGVGGAIKTGYRWALKNSFDVIIKVDGDGQMSPQLIPSLIKPLVNGSSDFAKGNRFDSPRTVKQMPVHRLIGNGCLSLFSKISTGYWSVNDPTNGFVAIRRETLEKLEPERLADSYFFESDLLFRLSIVRARISELPMNAFYGEEKSNLNVGKILLTFPFLHLKNFLKRVAYQYYVREWAIGSIELPVGLILLISGAWFGLSTFSSARSVGETITAGQAVTTAIAIILGFQLVLSFISHDIQGERKTDLSR